MRAEDVLPNETNSTGFKGVEVRKGTIAAFLHNARTWSNPDTSIEDRAAAESDIVADLPALRAVGLFDILSPRDAEFAAFIAGQV